MHQRGRYNLAVPNGQSGLMSNDITNIQDHAHAVYLAAQVTGKKDADGVLLDISGHSDTLAISCSGIVPGRVIYPMAHSSDKTSALKLFICDRRSLWFYKGIEGLTISFDETVSLVNAFIGIIKPRTTCAFGTSGGGYMALALAAKLGLDRALAFSPQTSISAKWRSENNDKRWDNNMSIIHKHIAPKDPYDIIDLIQNQAIKALGRQTEFHVVYSANDTLDRAQAVRLKGLSQVKTYRLDSAEHNTSAELSRRGRLLPVLETFIRSNGLNPDLNLGPLLEN
jgi:hypothetical protein